MGLFDFLKKKPDTPATPSAPTNTESDATAGAPAGPRYKGSNYSLPVEESAAPRMPIPPMPPMPPMPQQGAPAPIDFPYPPANILEELLMRATHEANLRPAFYQALVNEELLAVMLPKEGEPGGEVALEPGTEVQLQVLNDGKIPLFSSIDRIFDGGVSPEGISYFRVRGHDLLQMVQSTDCVLNPFSPAGKLLTSQEIQELLANVSAEAAAAPNVPVQLGPPATEPTELLEALREFNAAQPAIEVAYLAEMRLENSPEPPRLLLAFLTDDQDPAFLQELGPIIQGRLEGYQFVDMMIINPASDEPLNQYFAQQEPYYHRG